MKALRHQNQNSFLPGEYFKRIPVKPYIAQAAAFKRNPSSFHTSFVQNVCHHDHSIWENLNNPVERLRSYK
jgi:hypothetical protein